MIVFVMFFGCRASGEKNDVKVKTTRIAGGLHRPYKGLGPAWPKGP